MRKNTKIAIAVIVLAVLTLIIVLASTVFAVGSVRLIWYNTPNGTLASLTNENILKSSGVQGNSVFLLDRDKAIENIEKEYPRLRVIDIEICWPNIMNVHAIERQEVYAVRIGDKYAITDEYLKILDIVPTYTSTNINPVVLEIPDLDDNYQKGDTIEHEYFETFVGVYNGFIAMGRDLTDMRALCASMSYTNAHLTITTHFGVTIILDNPTQNTQEKMSFAIGVFDKLGTEDYGHGTIEVFLNSKNKPEGRYY